MTVSTIEGFRLSPQQRHLWLQQKINGDYVAQAAFLIVGNLNIEVLQEAITAVVNCHEVLRTNFHSLPGVKIPVQVIQNQNLYDWHTVDFSHYNSDEQSIKIENYLITERQLVNKNKHETILRLSLLIFAQDKYFLVLTLPSLCADGWTLNNLFSEISHNYSLCLKNQHLLDIEKPIQYIQFAEWQNELLEDEEAEAGKEYWQQQDFTNQQRLILPWESNLTRESKFASAIYHQKISSELTTKISDVATQYNTTTSKFLLACWQTLIWRLTKQSHIVINTVFNDRKYEELLELMGLAAKSLPVQCVFQKYFKFSEVLNHISDNIRQINKWQEYFIWSDEGVTNYQNLPIGFEFQELPEDYLSGDVSFSLCHHFSNFTPFKLKLNCLQKSSGITLELQYQTGLLSDSNIQRLFTFFLTLVTHAIDNIHALVSELEIINDQERHQLLVEFNHTYKNYPNPEYVHQLFEQQVQKTPEDIAVIFEDEKLTYSQLNTKANQLAHYLRSLGVGADVLVGLYVERSVDIIVGILGILKAGAAYLPLDPKLPAENLGFRLQDAQTPILLTQQSLVEKLPQTTAQIICLDTNWETIAQENQENLQISVQPDNLVYAIFTSGSTGKPKAVAIEHQQLINYLYGILERLNLPAAASFATVSTFAADLGNTVVFAALCTGGCLHILSQEKASDAQAIANYFQQYPIDCLKIVPSHLNALLTAASTPSILPRQCLILGGEASNWDLIQTIKKLAPNCQIFNHYGPTETTVGVLTYPVEFSHPQAKTVPLGKPLPNTQVFVLDEQLQPVPIGVPGELYVGGACLARSYLHRPELTQEKFIQNPFVNLQLPAGKFSQIIYKTGDLVRYLPDSNLEFLGRVDNQIKIRGFRIELGEIEATLKEHIQVQSAVVIPEENQSLAAYIVLNSESNRNQNQQSEIINKLRSFCLQKLPDYMIPSAFVLLKALPLTPNGKVDIQALLALEKTRPGLGKKYVAPRTPEETQLAEIWGKLLGLKQVGIHDNFFDLGGHSLIATQIISRIRQIFKVELPLRCLFETPTIAGLAVSIQGLTQQQQDTQSSPILACFRDQELPLSYAQQRLWFFSQLEPESSAYNIPSAIRLTGRLNIVALENSINEIVRRHENLRTNFQVVNGEAVQVINAPNTLKLPVIDLQNLPETEREAEALNLANLEAQKPFNLEKDSLLRVNLLRLGATDNVILFTMHHIISDGWSTGILIRELTTLYPAFDSNQKYNLPKLPVQYVDFAVWQREYLQGEVLQTQLNYWKQQLGGELPVLELPTDCPRPAIQTNNGATESFTLSLSLTAALKNLSQQEGVTLFMTLLAAFKVLLHRYTQQDDILVGTPIANRNRSEIEGLIGLFVNTLVLRTNLRNNHNFRELLQQVREVTLGAYDHQDLPFEQLVEELQPERDLSHNSLFQVMFDLQNVPTEVLHLPDLTLNPLKAENKTAKFDLSLSMVETDTGLRGSIEYNTDLFDANRITRMLGHFQTLLTAIIAHPNQNLSELPILTTTEHQQILTSWNSNQISVPQQCIHQLFEAQVAKNPDAVAVVFVDAQSAASRRVNKSLTYQQLNQKANQLSHYLQNQGVKPEALVGICLERSLELVVGVLGVLKAGGAYLPLDPAYPQERLAYMLEDAQVSFILTQAELLDSLKFANKNIICIDSDWKKIANESIEDAVSKVNINNLAYVIYTSGSTGKSKGVMIEHRSLVNAYIAWEKDYKLPKITSHLQMASFSFDVFSGDLVRALCSGGKLVLCPPELLLEPEKLYQLMLREKVDCAEFVPGVLRNLIQYLEQTQQHLEFMQLLICGSDSWYIQEYEKFRQFCGEKTRLINSFGLTEATIDSTFFETDTTKLSLEQLVPIGKPFANTQIYILDRYLQPLPVGVAGEIYLSGDGLARGYLNRPDLTAEKFVPNFFTQKAGECLYKTGDLGSWLPDGNIELIGRVDNQVKLRGFRIELGEIEAIIAKHLMVKESVVLVREDRPKQQQLVAYVVPELAYLNQITSNNLQQFLKEQLPNYMIPSAFVFLESFPITPNGKIDRRALPKPDIQEIENTFIAPRTETEIKLVQLWSEVLGMDKVGINDNFFELGGNSLLTTKLILKIRAVFQVNLPLRVLFESPTVASLAIHLEKSQQANSTNELSQKNMIEWDEETSLDSTIYPETPWQPHQTEPKHILLTGATGFLGAFLLLELLQQTNANIYCLVRAQNVEAGKKKLQETLNSYLILQDSFSQRIIPVIGDLSQPLLGLKEQEFQELAHQIDIIYHNGAWVHHIYPYSVLKAANVLGTQEVLRLACEVKTKPVHFISTASIFSPLQESAVTVATETDNLDDYPAPSNGYVQTKWVCEKLIKTAQQRGLLISSYRIGRVSGHSKTGVFNINDFLYKLIIGCIQLGSVPDRDIQEDIMPVDYVSQAIIHLSKQQKALGKAFHLVNNQLLHTNTLLEVIQSFGYPIQQLSYENWRSQLINISGASPEHPLYPLVPFFSEDTSQQKKPVKSGSLKIDCQNAIAGLSNSQIICPDINEKLLSTYISYLGKQGFLNNK
jgi:amino acid adenylation domain-containing protein/thioester reductase-like protein